MFDKLFNKNESSFILYFVLIFLGTAGLLAAVGLLPNELQEQSNGDTLAQSVENSALNIVSGSGEKISNQDDQTISAPPQTKMYGAPKAAPTQKVVIGGYPARLVIPSIDVDTQVFTPKDTDVDTLDHDLTKGPVYYPGSGTVAGGNMFIFGHSTGYKIVINKAYKVFNDIHTLNQGDEIDVVSNGNTFIYTVKSVSKVNKNETLVNFDTNSHILTLSTCNSFGAKTDRYVVTAVFSSVK
jgi:LPXTG-site transpeptidase (sortase) family protein